MYTLEPMSVPTGDIARTEIQEALDKARVRSLKASMEKHGLFAPILVCKAKDAEGKYDLIYGAHRLKAAQELEWPTIQANVYIGDLTKLDAQLIQLIENLHRRQLTAAERIDHERRYKAMWKELNPNAKSRGRNAKSSARDSAAMQGVAVSTVRRRQAKADGRGVPAKTSITPTEYEEPEVADDPILDKVAGALDFLYAYVAEKHPKHTRTIDTLRKDLL